MKRKPEVYDPNKNASDRLRFIKIVDAFTPRELDFLRSDHPAATRVRLLTVVCDAWPYPYQDIGPWRMLVEPLKAAKQAAASC